MDCLHISAIRPRLRSHGSVNTALQKTVQHGRHQLLRQPLRYRISSVDITPDRNSCTTGQIGVSHREALFRA